MASIGCRLGRVLPRINRITRQSANLILSRAVEVHESNIRGLVTTSSLNIQPQSVKRIDEESSPDLIKPKIEDTLDRLLYKLDMDCRKAGRINTFELTSILDTVRKNSFCTSTQALLLIRFLGKALADEYKVTRRNKVKEIVPLLKSLVKFDVSHYNAILKVHLENEEKVEVSELLHDMESNGVAPNRVTYQHLIGLYCLEGNIAGATTVLEQMKDEDMSINEAIFHSLLYGHSLNRDRESVNETLNVMEHSGLLLGSETYTSILLAAAKARDWERVEQVLVEAKNRDVSLDAGDYLKLIIALCENGMTEQAKPLIPLIPKKAGYFKELRCHLPQIILSGEPDLAFEIFGGYKFSGTNEGALRSHGLFMVRALVRSDVDSETCAKYVMELIEAGYTDAMGVYLSECFKDGKEANIQQLVDLMENKERADYRVETKSILSEIVATRPERLDSAITSLRKLKVFVDYPAIAKVLIRKNMDLDTINPKALAMRLRDETPSVPLLVLLNNMIAVLLSEGKPRYFQACSGFMLFTRLDTVNPVFWSNFLARAYLKTNSLEDFITILFVSKSILKGKTEAILSLYDTLVSLDNYQLADQPTTPATTILNNVIDEINKHKIGVPELIADKLNLQLADPDLKEKLEIAVKDFNSDYWTEEAETEFMNSRREMYKKSLKEAGYTVPANESRMYMGSFEIPEDNLDEMLRIKKILKRRNVFNPKLQDKIIAGMAKADDPEGAVRELKSVQQSDTKFNISATATNHIVQSFLRKGDADGAWNYMMDHSQDIFLNTYIDILKVYAQKGEHEKVLNYLALELDKNVINRDLRNLLPLVDQYEEAGDAENLPKVVDQIIQTRVDNQSIRPLLHSLVKVHLVRDDVKSALDSFTQLVNQYKCLPAKFDLFTRLVLDENVEDLQKVVDLSISVIGEELSLYDLTQTFLQQGRRAQAKRMLETPGLMYNHRAVTAMLKIFVQNNQLDCLEDMVRLSKNIFGCDRDYMYLTWVDYVKKDAEKVNEIWMEIQEEGHAPSVSLKAAIAKALRKGQMTIPFDTSDLDLDGQRVTEKSAKQKSSSTDDAAKKSENESAATDAAGEKNKSKSNPMATAIAAGNTQGVLEAIQQSKSTPDAMRDGIRYLIKHKEYAKASEIILAAEEFRPLRKPAMALVFSMRDNGQESEADEFIAKMPLTYRKDARYDILKKAVNNPESYYKLISTATAEDKSRYMLNGTFIDKLKLDQNTELKGKLEELAGTGHLPSCVLLGRAACRAGDADALVKYWNLNKQPKEMIYGVNNLEKLRLVVTSLNEDPSVIERATNEALAYSQEETLAILEYSTKLGLDLANVNTATLKRVANMKEYSRSAEAGKIVEQRSALKDKSESAS